MDSYDLAIIGAGPSGLFAAYYAGFRGLSTVVADALPEPGGQITAMYPEKMIYDVAGFPAIKGRDLVDNLVRQAAMSNPHYLLGNRVEDLEYVDGQPILSFADGTRLRFGAVIITGGLGSFTSRPLPAADSFTGEGVVYFVPELAAHTDKDVVIVGGGDSAFDWAQALHPIARSVMLVHRREKFRAHARSVTVVRDLGVPIVVNAQVARILGDGTVSGVEIAVKGEADARTYPADTVVAALGFTADLGPLGRWGLELDKRHIRTDSTTATNLPRVFAAGDIADYPGKVRLIATGFGEAATAVNNAAVAINPDAHLFPGHSSDDG
ncbi:NAD(P)/FAD-dependent oxidoreductase [Stackebrandtia nassauensis]|uniref:Ferredoxin--NADP reductase n=1 Tax=Stackebrandtia nassauensis (strain DSM 44728 / CIP 108903 / NRRL B-16338 / NBRC 102104 / LLR-40K-21) TaxID=446470 RepID=D3Q7U3_STANL|nr:NAD(P)/FAD-dependent oxidoreductase [Stackebrandtia nassauensis]ADD40448.1 FAD-dependent pyridine nucleotide-disulfide oxidoreductase [Stackebrandtia nassauensis DSM 44728]